MPQINYDKSAAADNATVRIGAATGINNFSDTSKIKLIANILSDDINNFAELTNAVVDNIYSSTATGRHLDAKGVDYGVYRKALSSISINSSDEVVFIETRDPSITFGNVFQGTFELTAGDIFDVKSGFSLTLLSNVVLTPSDTKVALSVKVEPSVESNSLHINRGDVFKIPTDSSLSLYSRNLQIRFDRPISTEVKTESDAEFRSRVEIAKNSAKQAVDSAIVDTILGTPNLRGFSFRKGERGSSTLDIGITTEDIEDSGSDEIIDSIVDMLRLKLNSVVAAGEDVEIYVPSQVSLLIEYDYSNVDISESVVTDTIYEAIKSTYRYSTLNTLKMIDIEEYVKNKIEELDSIDITSVSLFDVSIGEYIDYSNSGTVLVPKDSFILISKDDITRVA